MKVSGTAFVESGRGLPILLGHSLCLDHEMWAPQIAALSRHFRVIALDFRGHGASDLPDEGATLETYAEDVFKVADHLGLKRFGWAGLSMGGMVGMRLALAAPDRVAALALLDTDAEPDAEEVRTNYLQYLELYRQMGPTDISVRMTLGLFVRPVFAEIEPATYQKLEKRLLSNDAVGVYRASLAVIKRTNVLPRLSGIRAPALVLVGTDDVATPPDRAQKIRDAIRGSKYVELPESAHLTPLEQPKRVNEELVSFFKETLS